MKTFAIDRGGHILAFFTDLDLFFSYILLLTWQVLSLQHKRTHFNHIFSHALLSMKNNAPRKLISSTGAGIYYVVLWHTRGLFLHGISLL